MGVCRYFVAKVLSMGHIQIIFELFSFYLQGKQYINRFEKTVNDRSFTFIETCCRNQCCKAFNEQHQEKIHKNFWALGDYNKQSLLENDDEA